MRGSTASTNPGMVDVMTRRQAPDLDGLLAHALAHAKKSLVEEGALAALLHVVGRRENVLIRLDTSSDEAKRASYDLARLAAIAEDADAVVVVMEVWMSQRPDDGHDIRPSTDPQRIEAVMIVAHGRDAQRGTLHRIVRDQAGQVRDLTLIDAGGGFRGEATDVLPAVRPTPKERPKARKLLDRISRGEG